MKKNDQPIYLEIFFEEEEEVKANLDEILKSDDFKYIIKEQIYEKIKQAVVQKKQEFILFRVVYYGLDLVIAHTDYKRLLNVVLATYEQEEDYLKCVEVKALIDTL